MSALESGNVFFRGFKYDCTGLSDSVYILWGYTPLWHDDTLRPTQGKAKSAKINHHNAD